MKADLINNPIYGASARLAGYIRNDDFIGGVTEAVEDLGAGGQLLLFPEGTRTTRAPINRLKGGAPLVSKRSGVRSEERRVGEEGRSRWAPDHLKKKKKK